MTDLLIFNFDGTGNEPSDALQDVKYKAKKEDDNITNILKLHLMLGGNLYSDGDVYGNSSSVDSAKCFYYQGVGTYGGWLNRQLNLGLALESRDVASILNDAMEDFNNQYEPGMKVIATGFSRGAALARRFVSLIEKKVGVAEQPFVYLLAFDTVASIGMPNLSTSSRPEQDVVFENGNTISDNVVNALHLVSLDDKRRAFQPTLMNMDEHQPDRVKEVWFAGAHADVGGGYYRDGLSDVALGFAINWLLRVSQRDSLPPLSLFTPDQQQIDQACPLKFKGVIGVDDLAKNPDPMGKNHQQDRFPVIDWITLDDRVCCVLKNNQIDESALPLIHHSVATRVNRDNSYRPKSLANLKHRVWFSQFEQVEFEGVKQHIEYPRTNLKQLAVDDAVEVTVQSEDIYNFSGILVKSGEEYEITAQPNDFWFDRSIKCTADGWDRDDLEMGFKELPVAAMEPFRRVPDADWFTLCVTVGCNDTDAKSIGLNGTFSVTRHGELTAFANDLESKYGNNSGYIDIRVKRVL